MTTSNSLDKDNGAIGEFAIGEFVQGVAWVTQDMLGAVWSEPVRQKINGQLAVALIASGLISTQLPEQGSLTSGWFRSLSNPYDAVPKPDLKSSLHQFLAYTEAKTQNSPNNNFAEQSQYDKFSFAWSEPVRIKPSLNVALHQFFTTDTSPFPASTNISWLREFSEPVRVKPRLPEGEQQFLAFYPLPYVNYGWPQWLSEPVRVRPRLPEGEQQFLAFTDPAATTDSIEARWHYSWSEPVRIKPQLITDLQHFFEMEPTPPEPGMEIPWFNWMSEPVRQKAGLQAWHMEFTVRAALQPNPFSYGYIIV